MAADGMLALSWNNHSTTFCHMLSQIHLKDRYTDATVACEGKFYPVHRIVLSTCSKYFEEMFEMTSTGKHPIVLLQDVRKYELEALLSYMYAGVVSVAQKDLSRLIKIAELLQIKGLAVPDELPGEKNNQCSERTSSTHQKSSHSLDTSDSRTSPHHKRRRREEKGTSSKTHHSSSSRSLYNPDDDDIQEIKDAFDKVDENLMLGPLEDSNRSIPGNEGSRHHLSLGNESSQLPQASQESIRRPTKPGTDEMVYVKEEVLDDPGESQGDSIKSEIPYGSLDAGDESIDVPPDESDDYSQTSHLQVPSVSEPVAEALAGPSGIHEWLSGGETATGLPSVEDYGGEGSPPTSDLSQSQQMESLEQGGHNFGGRAGEFCREAEQQSFMPVSLSQGLKIHVCPYCSYRTPRRPHMVEHLRTHTGDKPFSCPHCPSKFSQKGTLTRHMRMHTRTKHFACPICPEKFLKENQLSHHMISSHSVLPQDR